MTPEEISEIFTYHPPKADQPDRYVAIRDMAHTFGHLIQNACPDSREKSLAITSLQQTVMWANAAIAIHE